MLYYIMLCFVYIYIHAPSCHDSHKDSVYSFHFLKTTVGYYWIFLVIFLDFVDAAQSDLLSFANMCILTNEWEWFRMDSQRVSRVH